MRAGYQHGDSVAVCRFLHRPLHPEIEEVVANKTDPDAKDGLYCLGIVHDRHESVLPLPTVGIGFALILGDIDGHKRVRFLIRTRHHVSLL